MKKPKDYRVVIWIDKKNEDDPFDIISREYETLEQAKAEYDSIELTVDIPEKEIFYRYQDLPLYQCYLADGEPYEERF